MAIAPSVVVAGSLAQRPNNGGHTWVFLQYLLGFRDLGWDVLFLDRLEEDMCVDAKGQPCPIEGSVNVSYLDTVMRRTGLSDYCLLYDQGRRSLGLTRDALMKRVDGAAFLLNVNGFIGDGEVLARSALKVFLDIDPGFGQIWCELGLHDPFRGHDVYLTVGENIGQPDCDIPTCGLTWRTTPQPVVLDRWPARSGDSFFTSVGSWRGPFGPLEYRGVTYGLRVHEFRKFAALPRLSQRPFQIALDIDEAEVEDLELLRANDWSLIDPGKVAADPWAYQSYIQSSKAEFMVAKNMYVQSRSGWFSDRSICYLASGKPVLAQDTGFARNYPATEGLLAFSDVDEALAGVEAISSDYDRHARAAREIAEEHFASRKVLGRLLNVLGVS